MPQFQNKSLSQNLHCLYPLTHRKAHIKKYPASAEEADTSAGRYPISDTTVLMLFGSQLDLALISEEILTAAAGQAAVLLRKKNQPQME